MILNTYAVLLVFVGLLRLALGGLVVAAGVAGLCSARRDEDRGSLTFLLALLLVGLNLASWPLLYLLLQSYVPEWPGVMCVYGVTQIGADSLGPSRHLPDLLAGLQMTKPALVFAGGAWVAVYALNRRTRTAPLLPRLFVLLVPLGLFAAADAAAELAYVAIPKKEVLPAAGCCTAAAAADMTRYLPPRLTADAGRPWLTGAYYGTNLGLLLALAVGGGTRSLPLPVLSAAVVTLGVSGLFLVEVAAPTLLGLPYHHCPYDLIPHAPGAVVAVGLHVAGFFGVGWAAAARWAGRCGETEPFLGETVHRLLRLAFWAYAASLAMLSLELILV